MSGTKGGKVKENRLTFCMRAWGQHTKQRNARGTRKNKRKRGFGIERNKRKCGKKANLR